eukprot:3163490-Pleurochrysis_carterae.AAC.3
MGLGSERLLGVPWAPRLTLGLSVLSVAIGMAIRSSPRALKSGTCGYRKNLTPHIHSTRGTRRANRSTAPHRTDSLIFSALESPSPLWSHRVLVPGGWRVGKKHKRVRREQATLCVRVGERARSRCHASN